MEHNIKTLDQMLGTGRTSAKPHIVKDLDTGVETVYSSGYKAMKAIDVEQRTNRYNLENGIKFEGRHYEITNVITGFTKRRFNF